MHSIAFARSIGVFEGGGVRGAAFAGAYEAAVSAGITFVGCVGASSGSIAATLIAAGLSPSQVLDVMATNLSGLLSDASPPPSFLARTAIAALQLADSRLASVAKWQFSLGLHSSERVEGWIDEILQMHLPNVRRPVCFMDLPRPLAIVATDLLTQTPKVFSKLLTPTTPVSFAVRSSCAIPFFFQPVQGEGALLVDGGLVANLPVFLISKLGIKEECPVLCFRLISNPEKSRLYPTSGIEMMHAVIDTALNGSTDVQLSLGQIRQIVYISTGNVRATDFRLGRNVIDELIENGRQSMTDFVRHEQMNIASTRPQSLRILRGFREALLEETATLIKESHGNIYTIGGDLSWLRELHIHLLRAVLEGREVRILCRCQNGDTYSDAIKGAIALGACIRRSNRDLLIRGTMVGVGSDLAKMITIEDSPEPHGRLYSFGDDRQFITHIKNFFEAEWQNSAELPIMEPHIEPIHTSEILAAIRDGVPQYRSLHMSFDDIDPKSVKPLSRYLERFKLARASEVKQLLAEYGLPNAARVVSSPWPITPPVFEVLRDGAKIVVDGAHRVFHSLHTGEARIRAVVIENPYPNLPAKPLSGWDQVQVCCGKRPREERYEHYQEAEFRPLREAFRTLAR